MIGPGGQGDQYSTQVTLSPLLSQVTMRLGGGGRFGL